MGDGGAGRAKRGRFSLLRVMLKAASHSDLSDGGAQPAAVHPGTAMEAAASAPTPSWEEPTSMSSSQRQSPPRPPQSSSPQSRRKTQHREKATFEAPETKLTARQLKNRMSVNIANMRHQLADVESIGVEVKAHQQHAGAMIDDAHTASDALVTFHEEIEGDFELMTHKKRWAAAYDSFQDATRGQVKDVAVNTTDLSAYLCDLLSQAEPDLKPASTAFIGFHPLDASILRVFHATEASEFTSGSTLRIRPGTETKHAIAGAWAVMNTGEGEFHNPHGLKRDSEHAISIAPLKSVSGKTFAVLTSGPPAVPDELLETITRHAGPLLERVWKTEQAGIAIQNVIQFVKRFAIDAHMLIFVNYEPGVVKTTWSDRYAAGADDALVWQWQPLKHTGIREFVLNLHWRKGTPIGVLTIECSEFTELTEQLILLLHNVDVMLNTAIETIEAITPGEVPPLHSAQSVVREFEAVHLHSAKTLETEIRQQIALFDVNRVFGELRTMDKKVVDETHVKVVRGALLLMGFKPKSLTTWDKILAHLKNVSKLKSMMMDVEYGLDGDEPRWKLMQREIHGLDHLEVEKRCTAPIKCLMRWLTTALKVHHIAMSAEDQEGHDVLDPEAEKIFKQIDRDGDGKIDINELIAHMHVEADSSAAHRLLRMLDEDHDHMISTEEWHKAWSAGMVQSVLDAAKKKKKAKSKGDKRLIPHIDMEIIEKKTKLKPIYAKSYKVGKAGDHLDADTKTPVLVRKTSSDVKDAEQE